MTREVHRCGDQIEVVAGVASTLGRKPFTSTCGCVYSSEGRSTGAHTPLNPANFAEISSRVSSRKTRSSSRTSSVRFSKRPAGSA